MLDLEDELFLQALDRCALDAFQLIRIEPFTLRETLTDLTINDLYNLIIR